MPPPSFVKDLSQPYATCRVAFSAAPSGPGAGDLRAVSAGIASWIYCRISHAIHSVAERWRRAARDRKAERGMARLPDHVLRDIGVSRIEAGYFVHRSRASDARLVGQPGNKASSHSPRLNVIIRNGTCACQARSRTISGARTTSR